VSALREFCPHCATPLRRGLRESRPDAPGEESDEELKRNRRRVFVAGAAILLALGIVGKVSWFAPIVFRSHERPKGPVVIEAEQVYDAYRKNAHAAARRFRGREMVVSGEFVRIVPDGEGNPDLRLKTANPDAPLGADLVRMSYDRAAQLRPGQRVTVSCQRIRRTGEERWLQNCAIQTVGEGRLTAPPQSPSPLPAPLPGGGNSG
jgi:hypothetical protein